MSFGEQFIWGAAAASYQIEGATQGVDGCGESVWDMVCKRDGFIRANDNGYTACDHYKRYKEDVAIMKQIGLQAYRLSVMWPRVIPQGTGAVNQQGLAFYDRLVDELCAAGIAPWVTLFHWDYPLALFNRGGWLNDDSPLWFEEYTRVVVDKLSDRVRNWFTLNEPACFIGMGHQDGIQAPGIKLPGGQVNRAWHNALLSHGRAVKVIREESKSRNPNVGAAPVFSTYIPASEDQADIEAARTMLFGVSKKDMWQATWGLDPLFAGSYPQDGLELWGDEAPPIKAGDLSLINQELDFLGLNIYSSSYVKAGKNGEPEIVPLRNDHPHTDFGWPVTPEALYWASRFLYERYKRPIVITENGLASNDWVSVDGKVHDPTRIDFLTRYLRGLKRSAGEGIDVMAYFQWSIMDNFEWTEGYHKRFGLVHVDYRTQKRTIKDSGYWYSRVISSNGAVLDEGGDA